MSQPICPHCHHILHHNNDEVLDFCLNCDTHLQFCQWINQYGEKTLVQKIESPEIVE